MTSQNQLCVDGLFRVEISTDSGGGTYTPIPDMVHERSELTLEANKPTGHVHVFTTVNLDVVDVLVKSLVLQPSPIVRVRIGLVKSGGNFWFPWQNHLLVSFYADPTGKGYQLTFVTGDMLEALSRQYFTAAHQGLVSDIVEKIAANNGLQTIIEPTKGSWSLIQSQQSDFSFIEKLASRAVNGSGMGGYRFFIRDNVLHFHTINYYSSVRVADVFSLPNTVTTVASDVQDSINMGATGVRVVGIDPYEGKEYAIQSDDSLVLTLGNQTPNVKGLRNFYVPIHPSINSTEELRAIGQNKYASARSNLFSCTAYVERGYPVQVNDLIRVVYNSPSAHQSPWGGLYCVTSVKHSVIKGVSNSVIHMERGEFETTRLVVRPKTNDGTSLQSEFESQGHRIDLTAVESSEKTKGPPDSFTGGRFVKVVRQV